MCSRQQLHIPFLFPARANLPPCDFPSKNSAAIDFDQAERDLLAPTPPVGTVTQASAVPARPRCPGASVILLNLPSCFPPCRCRPSPILSLSRCRSGSRRTGLLGRCRRSRPRQGLRGRRSRRRSRRRRRRRRRGGGGGGGGVGVVVGWEGRRCVGSAT